MTENLLETGLAPKPASFWRQRFSRKWVWVAVLVLTVVVTGSIARVFFFRTDSPDNPESATAVPILPGTVLSAPDYTRYKEMLALPRFERVPLNPGEGMALLNMELVLELRHPEDREQVIARQPAILLAIQDRIRQYTGQDLAGPEGKIQLKYDLVAQINTQLPGPLVRNVYFINFVMQ